ncbi:hypothetical protein NEOLEDRAFT_762404 [Neolentinus lepideus HHB14362 ss-1]|uniref:Uncharacterized protein n=1 Tax=Neolentinus lepideus HHB14362 ss-1 TaxID=1314782 RepID=A0A165PNS7_9AGAM|nr:hypothetical protein NEOLEDRAFT_762404 [Neolentinus lepideus HHB14362 ss-1]
MLSCYKMSSHTRTRPGDSTWMTCTERRREHIGTIQIVFRIRNKWCARRLVLLLNIVLPFLSASINDRAFVSGENSNRITPRIMSLWHCHTATL